MPGGWYALIAMLVVVFFAIFDRQLLVIAAQPIADSLGLSDTQMGLVQGLGFTVFTLLALYPIALLADRWDRRLILALCVLTWSIGTAACGLATGFTSLFIATVAVAAGEAGLGPLMMSFIPDLFKGRKRVTANSVQYFFNLVGASLALAASGWAVATAAEIQPQLPSALQGLEPWRITFIAVLLPAPLLLLVIWFMRLPRLVPVTREQPDKRKATSLAVLGNLFRQHRLAYVGVMGGFGLYGFAVAGFTIWLPMIATRMFGATPEMNGYGMGVGLAAGTICGVTAGTLLMRRVYPTQGSGGGLGIAWRVMVFAAPILLAFLFVTSANMLFALFALVMFVSAMIGVFIPTMMQDMAPAQVRTRFLAMWYMVYTLMGGIAPVVTGGVSDLIGGDNALLTAMVIVALPTWIVAIFLLKRGQRAFSQLVSSVRLAELDSGLTT